MALGQAEEPRSQAPGQVERRAQTPALEPAGTHLPPRPLRPGEELWCSDERLGQSPRGLDGVLWTVALGAEAPSLALVTLRRAAGGLGGPVGPPGVPPPPPDNGGDRRSSVSDLPV